MRAKWIRSVFVVADLTMHGLDELTDVVEPLDVAELEFEVRVERFLVATEEERCLKLMNLYTERANAIAREELARRKREELEREIAALEA